MKRLVLIRHAKTEHEGYERDYDRQLVERGIDDALNVAGDLKKWKIIPQVIISSPAARAIHTARLFAYVLGFQKENIIEEKQLYFDYTTHLFLDLIQDTENSVDTIFVVGHNPFIHYIAQNMCKKYDGHMPTCSTVVIDFNVDTWAKVEPREGSLFLHLYPKIYN